MAEKTTVISALEDVAIRVRPEDDVAVVRVPLRERAEVRLEDGRQITVGADIPPGHRFALLDIEEGDLVRQYGEPIGTSKGIRAGEWVTRENLSPDVPVVRDLPEDLEFPAPEYVDPGERLSFRGYRRPDGRVGTRNFVAVVPTSMCASTEAQKIAWMAEMTSWDRERFPDVDGVVPLPHNKGCGCPDGTDVNILLRTLRNYAAHPNVGAVLFLDLGCEKTNRSVMGQQLESLGLGWDKPSHWIGIQEIGGTQAAIKAGAEWVESILPEVNQCRREDIPASELWLGVKCGGSDGFSGLSANPALGRASDLLVKQGGGVLLTEVPEFCGAEHVLAHRARNAEVGREVYAMVDWYKEHAARVGARLDENPSPGNVEGGLLNITIKSLGAIAKGGATRVEGVVGYAEAPESMGLHLMQGPGYDQESTPGLVGAGAQVVVFTTGRGTTIGNAIAPVIKLATNTPIFERMEADLDLSAGGIIDGTESLEEVGERVFHHVLKVASGEVPARAEETGHREFQVWAETQTSL